MAEKVSRVSFSHVVQRIASHAKGFKASLGPDDRPARGNPRSMTVAIGHSLGAVILENTILRSLTAETDNFRDDFPDKSEPWGKRNLIVQKGEGGEMTLREQAVPELRPDLREILDEEAK